MRMNKTNIPSRGAYTWRRSIVGLLQFLHRRDSGVGKEERCSQEGRPPILLRKRDVSISLFTTFFHIVFNLSSRMCKCELGPSLMAKILLVKNAKRAF